MNKDEKKTAIETIRELVDSGKIQHMSSMHLPPDCILELDARLSAIEIRLEKMVASFDFHMQNIFDRTSCLEKSFDNHLYPPPPICLCEDVKLANDAGFIGDDIVCKIHPTNNMNPKPEKPTVELALMVLKQYKHEKCQDSESMTNELNCAIEILEKANGDGTK